MDRPFFWCERGDLRAFCFPLRGTGKQNRGIARCAHQTMKLPPAASIRIQVSSLPYAETEPIRMDELCFWCVRERRLELPRRLTHAPQTCLSTCSSTLAYSLCLVQGKGYYSRFSSFVKAEFSDFARFSSGTSPAVSMRSCTALSSSTPIIAREPWSTYRRKRILR